YKPRITCSFTRVSCNKGHSVKTLIIRQHQAVAFLSPPLYWFLTATPIWNQDYPL
ncbi:hypothetical protein BO71DRAFT_302648, partial [Aspergillus ellipticus CBS 707.79]